MSVSFLPIEVLPAIFRYGYATPFYNVSRAVKTIVFDTRNQGESVLCWSSMMASHGDTSGTELWDIICVDRNIDGVYSCDAVRAAATTAKRTRAQAGAGDC